MALVFDIETVKDDKMDAGYVAWKLGSIDAPATYKDPLKIAEYKSAKMEEANLKFGLSPLTGKIMLIGLLFDYKPDFVESMGIKIMQYSLGGKKDIWIVHLEGEETGILANFWMILSAHTLRDGEDLISFNGKAFDLPYIMHRTTINSIAPPRKMNMIKHLNKYQHSPHFDVYNWFDGGSLVEWAYRNGLTKSLAREGGMMQAWYNEGQMQLIKDKNSMDLSQTYMLYDKVRMFL